MCIALSLLILTGQMSLQEWVWLEGVLQEGVWSRTHRPDSSCLYHCWVTLTNFDLRVERSLERGVDECKSVVEKLAWNKHLPLLTHEGGRDGRERSVRKRERERESVCLYCSIMN